MEPAMRRLLSSLLAAPLLAVLMNASATDAAKPRTALVIHGGAGVIERSALSAADERAIRTDLNRALDAGNAVLANGGAALDAVQAVIEVLEDSPRFNAGKGAVFNAKGRHELDASIMEGHTQRAGAIAGVTTVRHPIQLARAVMEHSKHVMLAGEGAEAFADTRPEIARVRNDWFDTDVRRQQLEQAQAAEKAEAVSGVPAMPGGYFGTVGAVALDAQGHIAAATSTGGMTNKRWGRVGDSPIIGAGTWADARCGVSGTGWGEFYIRFAVARDICARVAYRGDTLAVAAQEVVNRIVPAAGGDGGAIALDADGNIAMPFNTSGMYRGWIRPDGSRGVAVFRDGECSGLSDASNPQNTSPARGGRTGFTASGSRLLLRLRLDPGFATPLHFFLADILDMGAEHPLVAERVDDRADAIAPELVLDGLDHLGAGLHRAIDRCVCIGHVDHEAAGGAAARFRTQRIPGRHFVRQHEARVADLDLRVADLVAHRQAKGLFRTECVAIELQGLGGVVDDDRRRDAVVTAGDGIDCHGNASDGGSAACFRRRYPMMIAMFRWRCGLGRA
jgi:beta-aspartyl-peptidase (threonine type)